MERGPSARQVLMALCLILALVASAGFTSLAGCGGATSTEVGHDPDCELLRDDLPMSSSDGQALTSGPAWGRAGWRPDVPVFEGQMGGLELRQPPVLVPVVEDVVVALTLRPDVQGLAGHCSYLLRMSEATTQVRFRLDAGPQVTVSGEPAVASSEFHDGVLTVGAAEQITAGETWALEIGWQDQGIEETIDLFPEGGGSVLANLVSYYSTFFTFGYDYWPRLVGGAAPESVLFEVTHPDDLTMVLSGEPTGSVDNGDGTVSETWRAEHLANGVVGLVMAEYDVATGSCGQAALEVYGIPGLSIDEFPIVVETYIPVLESMCDFYVARFGQPAFSSIRFAGVDERFTNGYSTPGLVIVPNYVWDDDDSGSFTLRNFYLAHELAHAWWGNDVFISDARDAWLVEGMADYVAAEAVEATEGEEAGRYIWLWEVEPYLSWLRQGGEDHPVVPEAGTQMEPLVYYVKGAWVLRMLETVMGAEGMGELLRQFRLDHPFSVATTDEFVALAEETAGEDLGWFFEQWLSGTGVMSLEASGKKVDGGVEVSVSQRQAWSDSPERYYRMPVTIQARRGKASATQTFELDGQSGSFLVEIE